MLIQIRNAKSYVNKFLGVFVVKNGRSVLVHGTPESTVSRE